MTGIALGGYASNSALLVGGLVLLGATTLYMMSREKTKVSMAAQTVTHEGIEDMLFSAVLDNADRPETVLKNEDRVREHIKSVHRSLVSDLMRQYTSGRLNYQELRQEVKATSLLVHEHLGIPVRPGAEKKFQPAWGDYPRKYGHRNKKLESMTIDHGSVSRGTGDCDCLPSNLERIAPGPGSGLEATKRMYGRSAGVGNKRDDGYEPPSYRGYKLGRGNSHDDNTIPLVPMKWGMSGEFGITDAGISRDFTHGQNSLPFDRTRKMRMNHHSLAAAVMS